MKTMSIVLAAVGLTASVCAYAQGVANPLWGSPVPVAEAQRSIVLTAETRWVNVNQGEVIRFVIGGSEFGWKFDGLGTRSFDLQPLAPSGALARPVTVYVAGSARNRQ